MVATRWEPFADVLPLRDVMQRLLEESYVGSERLGRLASGRTMPLDVYEASDHYQVEVALPGVRPDDVEVTALGNSVTIEVTRRLPERHEEQGAYLRRERYGGALLRTVELPHAIEPDRIRATFELGVLQLFIPKAEHARPKRVRVEMPEPAREAVPADGART